jgi:hypothetical protein
VANLKKLLSFIHLAGLCYTVKIMRYNFIIFILFLSLNICGCGEDEKKTASAPAQEPVKAAVTQTPPPPSPPGCKGCHADIKLDKNHDLACADCHQGDNTTNEKAVAHQGLIADAASPGNMASTCGECHPERIETCGRSGHFTLNNAVNLVRDHFGIDPAGSPLDKLTEIPDSDRPPENKEELVDDLLRRRCLRCHVYSRGDSYPYVRRGTGCAACHLRYTDGKLSGHPASHAFTVPGERQCLSCHYGNHVGSDFVGGYEHDYNWAYRTPFTTREPFLRPYGVEQHNLVPDIHQQKGMTCLDCHSGAELSGQKDSVQCVDCHAPARDTLPALRNVRLDKGRLILKTGRDGKELQIPQLEHPAHAKYMQRAACQVCHAQWGFNDRATHMLLSYSDDVDPWERLAAQSSSEAESFIEHNMYSDEDEHEPTMPDQISGRRKSGIWYAGFTRRRWEDILIKMDKDNIIKVFRPILDLRLSAVDEDGEVIADFDNLTGTGSGLLPYTPHTTGPAGLFYEKRFSHLLAPRPAASNSAGNSEKDSDETPEQKKKNSQ